MKHELRQGFRALVVWSLSVGLFVVVCVCMFPQMRGEMEGVTRLFASMGAFTAAFGLDKLNFGTLIGFYAVECGTILGLGGAFFAALTAVNALSGEEREHTAEFLLTHPVGRARIVAEKLVGALTQVLAFNVIVFLLSVASIWAVGEAIPWRELGLLHSACLLLQLELTGVCFGISAFTRRSGSGIGIGIAGAAYALNLVANISRQARFLKYITPFAYADGADILANGALNGALVATGMLCAAVGIGIAFWKYLRKDIT